MIKTKIIRDRLFTPCRYLKNITLRDTSRFTSSSLWQLTLKILAKKSFIQRCPQSLPRLPPLFVTFLLKEILSAYLLALYKFRPQITSHKPCIPLTLNFDYDTELLHLFFIRKLLEMLFVTFFSILHCSVFRFEISLFYCFKILLFQTDSSITKFYRGIWLEKPPQDFFQELIWVPES